MGVFNFNAAYAAAAKVEPPRPLMRELPPAEPFPVSALGPTLGKAALAINDLTLAPLGLCGNAVLAAGALAAQAHCDVVLPPGMARPCSLFLMTIGESGERKTDVDLRASRPIAKREEELRAVEDAEKLTYENDRAVHEGERKRILAQKGKGAAWRQAELAKLGAAPLPPLDCVLTCDEPTVEGLIKLLVSGQPSVGVFSGEGGVFVGGHGMSDDNRLKTAANLSKLWDGQTVKRVRAGDGTIVLPGRRVSLHLMCQPDVAALMLGDELLVNQGLLSRVLLSAPESTCGTRFSYNQRKRPQSNADLHAYSERVYEILSQDLPLAPGKSNQLEPRRLALSDAAQRLWWAFADEVEGQIGAGGELEPIKGLANKLPEHAAQIAAILQTVANIRAAEVGEHFLVAGIELANHYGREAMRLFQVGKRNADLVKAEKLLEWLQHTWTEPLVSCPDVYQCGPRSVREAATARRLLDFLDDHGWIERDDTGGEIKGVHRQVVWRPV